MPKFFLGSQNNELYGYIYEKIVMLEDDFYIRLTGEEKRRFYEQPDETHVDIYARRLIMEKL